MLGAGLWPILKPCEELTRTWHAKPSTRTAARQPSRLRSNSVERTRVVVGAPIESSSPESSLGLAINRNRRSSHGCTRSIESRLRTFHRSSNGIARLCGMSGLPLSSCSRGIFL